MFGVCVAGGGERDETESCYVVKVDLELIVKQRLISHARDFALPS